MAETNLEESSHDIEDGRLADGGVLGFGGERRVAGHQEVKIRSRNQRRDQADQIVVHIRRVSKKEEI